jgi:hypothetical protein
MGCGKLIGELFGKFVIFGNAIQLKIDFLIDDYG